MASTRLTVSIKEQLIQRLIEHAFTARSRELISAERELVLQVYNQQMDTHKVRINGGSGPDKTMREVLASLPAGWPAMLDQFKVRAGSDMIRLDFYDGIKPSYGQNNDLVGLEKIPMRDQKNYPFPPGFSSSSTLATYEARDPVTIRLEELKRVREDLLEEISSARHSARATINSVSTIQKLIMVWPEVEAFAAPFMQKETQGAAILPVVARERLNEALGLPPGVGA